MKSALIVTGGQISHPFLKAEYDKNIYDIVIGVDSGCDSLYNLSIRPDIMIGDFDSISPEVLNYFKNNNGLNNDVKLIAFDERKDFTDTELAIRHLIEHYSEVNRVTVLGATGNRMDHTLSTVMMLSGFIDKLDVIVKDSSNHMSYLKGPSKMLIKKESYEYFSLLAITDQVTGINYEGAKYPLYQATVKLSDTLGVSNEWIDDIVKLSIDTGICLVIKSKDQQ